MLLLYIQRIDSQGLKRLLWLFRYGEYTKYTGGCSDTIGLNGAPQRPKYREEINKYIYIIYIYIIKECGPAQWRRRLHCTLPPEVSRKEERPGVSVINVNVPWLPWSIHYVATADYVRCLSIRMRHDNSFRVGFFNIFYSRVFFFFFFAFKFCCVGIF